ncbi:uncharacterized protein LOC124153864 [Ischnura elegans]|uniref:uncharacterized protein LOC124153864 n=1 Tax=Ischnura elegans TaxID=197161 RepID=UPI001ED87028|nr:uncharacterized protein LOC124153864 [Ischnura elegans]
MRAHTALLILCFGTVGLLAAPDRTFKTASAAGFGPGGYQYQTDPNGVFISGPGYYAGATTFNGVPPNFQFPSFNFPAFQFPAFPNFFGGPGTYAQNFPFNLASAYQMYLNSLAQNTAAIAKPNNRPIKYSVNPRDPHSSSSSSSSSSSNFHFPQNPFFPPLAPQPPLPFDAFLGNRFGEEGGQGGQGVNSVGSSVSSSVVSTGQPGSGVSGTFSSSVHGSSNVNGNKESFHVSTTGVHENGQVTSVTVHKP